MPTKQIASGESIAPWTQLRDKIFTGHDPEQGLFRDETWSVVFTTGGLVLDADVFDALAKAARSIGDDQYVLLGYRDQFDQQPAFLADWELAALEGVAAGSVLGHIDSVSFGASGTWARYSSPEGFGVLGSTKQLMSRVLGEIGGEGAMRGRLASAVGRGEIGFGDQGKKYMKTLMTAFGWGDRAASK